MLKFKKFLLITSALCSVAVAVLHIYIIFQGAWAYRFFGAGETLATMAEQGSWIPDLLTSVIVVAFFLAAAYFFSAAGLIAQLPLLRIGIVTIAAVYTLRGAVVFPALLFGMKISPFDFWSSLVSLTIGLIHIAGTSLYWQGTRHQT